MLEEEEEVAGLLGRPWGLAVLVAAEMQALSQALQIRAVEEEEEVQVI
jgi:hypothetical protein